MISVVIPLYNKAPYVRQAVLSVLNQSLADFELLVVDNCSTDNWQESLTGINDNRMRFLFEPNKGVSYARNCGIKEAKFQWICFLDADDFWEVDHLLTLHTMTQVFPQAGALSNSYNIIDVNKNTRTRQLIGVVKEGDYWQVNNFFKCYNLADVPVHTSAICVQKTILNHFGGFDTSIKYGEDVLLWVKIFFQFPIYLSNYFGCTYQLAAENRSNVPGFLLEELPVIAKLEACFPQDEKCLFLKKDFRGFIAKHLFVSLMANIKTDNLLGARRFFKDKRLYAFSHKHKLGVAFIICYLPHNFGSKIAKFFMQKGYIN